MKNARILSLMLVYIMILSVPAAALSTPRYIAKERRGKISVSGVDGLVMQSKISVASLPNFGDRAILKMGLPLYSPAELSEFLENFCS